MPLQQALRHQHRAFQAFYDRRARYPRFKSRRSRQTAHYTRSAFSMRGGVLRLAKTDGHLRYAWTWPDTDVAGLDPALVIISREPDGRWYVTFTVDAADPEPLPGTGRVAGVDLGVKHFAVTSGGNRSPTRATWSARLAGWPATSGARPAAGKDRPTGPRPRPKSPAPIARSATRGPISCTVPAPASSARTT